MFSRETTLARFDADLYAAMQQEAQRQEDHIELIASENYTSPAVMEAQGSVLTNKYAEGYPHKRYYGGCEYVDVVEQLAIDRAKQLFGADYANVQPHSGSQANSAVYLALIEAGDTILGMSLAHGGHLTHGATVSSSGKLYNAVQYGIDEQGLIDYARSSAWPRSTSPRSSSPATPPTPRCWTSPASVPSPMPWVPTCSSTWPTSPAWSPPASTPTRSPSPTWSPAPPTRPARSAWRPDPGQGQRSHREEAQLGGLPGAQGGR